MYNGKVDIFVTGYLSSGQDFLSAAAKEIGEDNIRFQKEEVQAIKFVTVSELQEMRENNELVKRDECYDVLADYLFRI